MMKVLHRTLGEVLTFGNELRRQAAFDKNASYATKTKLDGKRYADGSAADDDDLVVLLHSFEPAS
jgi:hypothetical protein